MGPRPCPVSAHHRFRALIVGILVLGMGGCAIGPLPAAEGARRTAPWVGSPSFDLSLAPAFASVVSISSLAAAQEDSGDASQEERPTGRERLAEAWLPLDKTITAGSGFFIDGSGLVVTAAHVVADAGQVFVKTADLQVFSAKVVGIDEDADIALLRTPYLPPDAPRFGRSGALRRGDWVLAIGDPFGLPGSVVAGIVSGQVRHLADAQEGYFIQSAMTLNPGSSGGPLLDASGAIVGMNLRTIIGPYGSDGVSFSMPIEIVRQLASEMRDGNMNPRPRLGASYEDVPAVIAMAAGRVRASGALVTAVDSGGNAEKLSLRVGDIVVAMNDQPVEDSVDLARLLLNWRNLPGTRLIVWRHERYEVLQAR